MAVLFKKKLPFHLKKCKTKTWVGGDSFSKKAVISIDSCLNANDDMHRRFNRAYFD